MRTSFGALALSATLLAGAACKRERPSARDGAPPPASSWTAAATSAAAPAPPSVRHDCAPIEPRAECAAPPRESDALVAIAEALTELPARHHAPPASYWEPVRRATAAAAKVAASTLSLDERVAVENAALHVALAAEQANEAALATEAASVARRLAPSADERARVEAADERAAPRGLEDWLGPRSEWTERTRDGLFFHETVHHHTRRFRLVRTARARANFSELVAVDVAGEPFVTHVLGSLEARLGFGDDAPACVALLEPKRLRCDLGSAIAAVRDTKGLPASHFFERDADGSLRCNGCHTQGGSLLFTARDLGADEAPRDLARRRAELLERLRVELAPVWRRAR